MWEILYIMRYLGRDHAQDVINGLPKFGLVLGRPSHNDHTGGVESVL